MKSTPRRVGFIANDTVQGLTMGLEAVVEWLPRSMEKFKKLRNQGRGMIIYLYVRSSRN